jgi:hypothetical protein
VSVFLSKIADVKAGRFEGPQAEQPEQTYEREVVAIGRHPCRGEHRLELQVGQPELGD